MLKTFALIVGIAYIVVGVLGFLPPAVTAPPAEVDLSVDAGHGLLLGLFPINLLHNIVHLAVGVLALAASRSTGAARQFSRGLAIFYGLLAVMGLIPGLNTTFGLIPIYGNDVWLHAITAIAAAYFGWAHRETDADLRGRRVTTVDTIPPR